MLCLNGYRVLNSSNLYSQSALTGGGEVCLSWLEVSQHILLRVRVRVRVRTIFCIRDTYMKLQPISSRDINVVCCVGRVEIQIEIKKVGVYCQ